MIFFTRDSFLYLVLSFSLTWCILQLALKPADDPAIPLFPTTGHNENQPLDVDGDGVLRPGDTAVLLESLQSLAGQLPVAANEICTPHPYLDVDGDGFLSEADLEAMFSDHDRIPALAPAVGPYSPSEKHAKPFLARK